MVCDCRGWDGGTADDIGSRKGHGDVKDFTKAKAFGVEA